MKKYFITIASFLFLVFGVISCSNVETKTQNQVVARPTIPITKSEVQIGTQVWMTKNLNVSRYRNGDPIPQVTNTSQWENLTSGAWCYYNNDPINGPIYGKLYNWYALSDPRGLTPVGWHIPSNIEWSTLISFLGGYYVAGGKMKATILWSSPNVGGNNSSGFSALPGGFRGSVGSFNIGRYGFWWSMSEYTDTTSAWNRELDYDDATARADYVSKYYGFSVRCIKD